MTYEQLKSKLADLQKVEQVTPARLSGPTTYKIALVLKEMMKRKSTVQSSDPVEPEGGLRTGVKVRSTIHNYRTATQSMRESVVGCQLL